MMKTNRKRAIAVFMAFVLLAGFAACGKETVEPADNQEEWTESAIAAGEETETESVPIETTTEEDPTLAD